jgi:hypothetical protein
MNQVSLPNKQVFLASAVNCIPVAATPIKSMGVYIATPMETCSPKVKGNDEMDVGAVKEDLNTSGLELLSKVMSSNEIQPCTPAVVSLVNLKYKIRTFHDSSTRLWIIMADLDPYVAYASLSRFKYRLMLKDNNEQCFVPVPQSNTKVLKLVTLQCLSYQATLLYLKLHGKYDFM